MFNPDMFFEDGLGVEELSTVSTFELNILNQFKPWMFLLEMDRKVFRDICCILAKLASTDCSYTWD